jgi:hypothetical protein
VTPLSVGSRIAALGFSALVALGLAADLWLSEPAWATWLSFVAGVGVVVSVLVGSRRRPPP